MRSKRSVRRRRKLSKLDDLVGDAELRKKRIIKQEKKLILSDSWGAMHSKPAREQMMSPWFILIALLTVLQMVRMVSLDGFTRT